MECLWHWEAEALGHWAAEHPQHWAVSTRSLAAERHDVGRSLLLEGFPEVGSRAGSGRELPGSLYADWSTGWRLAVQ